MRPSNRTKIIAAALKMGADTPDATLQQIAHAAGVTKQGLLYHFPDRVALQQALIQHVFSCWEHEMSQILGRPLEQAEVAERVRAYAQVAARGHSVEGEARIYAEFVYRVGDLSWYQDWARRWFLESPAGVSQDPRLLTAWLAANGLWSVLTSRKIALSAQDVEGVLEQIAALTAPHA